MGTRHNVGLPDVIVASKRIVTVGSRKVGLAEGHHPVRNLGAEQTHLR